MKRRKVNTKENLVRGGIANPITTLKTAIKLGKEIMDEVTSIFEETDKVMESIEDVVPQIEYEGLTMYEYHPDSSHKLYSYKGYGIRYSGDLDRSLDKVKEEFLKDMNLIGNVEFTSQDIYYETLMQILTSENYMKSYTSNLKKNNKAEAGYLVALVFPQLVGDVKLELRPVHPAVILRSNAYLDPVTSLWSTLLTEPSSNFYEEALDQWRLADNVEPKYDIGESVTGALVRVVSLFPDIPDVVNECKRILRDTVVIPLLPIADLSYEIDQLIHQDITDLGARIEHTNTYQSVPKVIF